MIVCVCDAVVVVVIRGRRLVCGKQQRATSRVGVAVGPVASVIDAVSTTAREGFALKPLRSPIQNMVKFISNLTLNSKKR